MAELHISSLVVHGLPQRVPTIRTAIANIAGAEIAIAEATGKMIVTLETDSQGAVADTLTKISLIDGVMSATLVFHHVDDAE